MSNFSEFYSATYRNAPKLKLYYDATIELPASPPNEGFDKALGYLRLLADKGVQWELVDTSQMSEEKLWKAYFESTLGPSMSKHYKVGWVFGSSREHGYQFGRGVPALVVYDDFNWGRAIDVYPHEKRGHIATIKEYLEIEYSRFLR